MFPARRSIVQRTRTIILLTSVVVLLATAAAFSVYEIASFKSQLVRNLATLATVVADNSVFALALDQPSSGEDVLAALKVEPDIELGALYDAKGVFFAAYPRTIARSKLPVSLGPPGHRFQGGALVMTVPVLRERKSLGTLYLRCSLRGLTAQSWRYAAIAAAVLASTSVLAFLLSNFLQRRISDPILALTRSAQEVTEREDYSVRAPKTTEDEIGTLADAFNRMLSQTQEHQERLAEQARLLDLSTDAIFVRNLSGQVIYWSRGAEEMYGWPRQDILGKTEFEFLKTEFPAPLEEINSELFRNGRWSGDLVQTRRDGQRIHVSARWVIDSTPDGRPRSVLVTDTDITARKTAENLIRTEAERLDQLVAVRTARLQETIGELEAFSYSISHDMRAPLRAMQGYAKALLTDYGGRLDDKATGYLDRISRASNRLDLLIQDVLAYSRVAKSEIILVPVDLEHLIGDLLQCYPEFQPPQATITVQSPLHQVMGHPAYVTQCITNLLGNGVKFVPPGVTPIVRIGTERTDDKVCLWFEDNGIGIDPSHYGRIFKIFGQIHPQKKYGGTGIGLAIVRKAAQRMGGEAGFESELGKGSRFWIKLTERKDDYHASHSAG